MTAPDAAGERPSGTEPRAGGAGLGDGTPRAGGALGTGAGGALGTGGDARAGGALRADAVRVLDAWRAPEPEQDRVRQKFLRHLHEHPDGMFRECAPGHITASTAVLDSDGARVLLTLHSKLKSWLQLGGHCEPGDVSLVDAALREATEESGIAGLRLRPEPVWLDRHAVPCHPEGTWHLDVQYVAFAPAGARHVASDESDELCWFPVDALPESADGIVRRLVERAVRAGRPERP